MPEFLFVYGTLRRDFPSEMSRMLARNAEHVGLGVIRGVTMFVSGRCPAIVLGGDGEAVGDVYRMPPSAIVDRLDEYECVRDGLYDRVEVTAEVDGKYYRCMAYATDDMRAWSRVSIVHDGDFIEFIRREHVI